MYIYIYLYISIYLYIYISIYLYIFMYIYTCITNRYYSNISSFRLKKSEAPENPSIFSHPPFFRPKAHRGPIRHLLRKDLFPREIFVPKMSSFFKHRKSRTAFPRTPGCYLANIFHRFLATNFREKNESELQYILV